MSAKPSVTEVMEWAIPDWSPNLVIPSRWIEEQTEPKDRGPFYVIHCGDHDTAMHVCELMNEEVDRVLRAEAQ